MPHCSTDSHGKYQIYSEVHDPIAFDGSLDLLTLYCRRPLAEFDFIFLGIEYEKSYMISNEDIFKETGKPVGSTIC